MCPAGPAVLLLLLLGLSDEARGELSPKQGHGLMPQEECTGPALGALHSPVPPSLSPGEISRNRSSRSQVRRQAGASCLRGLGGRNPCQGHWLGNEQAGSGLQNGHRRPFSLCWQYAGGLLSHRASSQAWNIGQWPWQVSIRQGFLHICSASLISQKWMLTMASCFR